MDHLRDDWIRYPRAVHDSGIRQDWGLACDPGARWVSALRSWDRCRAGSGAVYAAARSDPAAPAAAGPASYGPGSAPRAPDADGKMQELQCAVPRVHALLSELRCTERGIKPLTSSILFSFQQVSDHDDGTHLHEGRRIELRQGVRREGC